MHLFGAWSVADLEI